MVRRYFHKYMNDKNYNRKWESKMGGPLNLDSTAWVSRDTVQEAIDGINAVIARLDKIINEMDEKCKH